MIQWGEREGRDKQRPVTLSPLSCKSETSVATWSQLEETSVQPCYGSPRIFCGSHTYLYVYGGSLNDLINNLLVLKILWIPWCMFLIILTWPIKNLKMKQCITCPWLSLVALHCATIDPDNSGEVWVLLLSFNAITPTLLSTKNTLLLSASLHLCYGNFTF